MTTRPFIPFGSYETKQQAREAAGGMPFPTKVCKSPHPQPIDEGRYGSFAVVRAS